MIDCSAKRQRGIQNTRKDQELPGRPCFLGVVFKPDLWVATYWGPSSLTFFKIQTPKKVRREKIWNSRCEPTKRRQSIPFLGGGFNYFLFPPLFGEDSHFDDHIFQVGWFNHQPAYLSCWKVGCDLLFTHWFSTRRVRFNSFQLYMDLSTVFFWVWCFFPDKPKVFF